MARGVGRLLDWFKELWNSFSESMNRMPDVIFGRKPAEGEKSRRFNKMDLFCLSLFIAGGIVLAAVSIRASIYAAAVLAKPLFYICMIALAIGTVAYLAKDIGRFKRSKIFENYKNAFSKDYCRTYEFDRTSSNWRDRFYCRCYNAGMRVAIGFGYTPPTEYQGPAEAVVPGGSAAAPAADSGANSRTAMVHHSVPVSQDQKQPPAAQVAAPSSSTAAPAHGGNAVNLAP